MDSVLGKQASLGKTVAVREDIPLLNPDSSEWLDSSQGRNSRSDGKRRAS